MDAYDVCTGCSCFIKRLEARCPFCGAEHVAAAATPRWARRVSRAQWLAVASALTMTGCSGAVDSPSTRTSSSEQGKGRDGGMDGSFDADAGGMTCSVLPIPFLCGQTLCNPATEICDFAWNGDPVQPVCEAADASYFMPAECASCPTCECYGKYAGGSCSCVELDAGGIGIQCAGCYGAPPARLERTSRTVS